MDPKVKKDPDSTDETLPLEGLDAVRDTEPPPEPEFRGGEIIVLDDDGETD